MCKGDYNHERTIELFIRTGFDGYISGERIEWESHEVHLPR